MKLFVSKAEDIFPSLVNGRWWANNIKNAIGNENCRTVPEPGYFSIVEEGDPQCCDAYIIFPFSCEPADKKAFLIVLQAIAANEMAQLKAAGIYEYITADDIFIQDMSFLEGKKVV